MVIATHTGQLRRRIDVAANSGKAFELHVPRHTKISGPLDAAIKRIGGRIFYY